MVGECAVPFDLLSNRFDARLFRLVVVNPCRFVHLVLCCAALKYACFVLLLFRVFAAVSCVCVRVVIDFVVEIFLGMHTVSSLCP